eukprot:s3302_g1.t1
MTAQTVTNLVNSYRWCHLEVSHAQHRGLPYTWARKVVCSHLTNNPPWPGSATGPACYRLCLREFVKPSSEAPAAGVSISKDARDAYSPHLGCFGPRRVQCGATRGPWPRRPRGCGERTPGSNGSQGSQEDDAQAACRAKGARRPLDPAGRGLGVGSPELKGGF